MGTKRYSAEVRTRALALLKEHEAEYPSRWKAVQAIAPKLGITPETLRVWESKAEEIERNNGVDPAIRLRDMEREIKELKRANEILKAASVFFATELDGPRRK